jgi:peptidase M50-like protein
LCGSAARSIRGQTGGAIEAYDALPEKKGRGVHGGAWLRRLTLAFIGAAAMGALAADLGLLDARWSRVALGVWWFVLGTLMGLVVHEAGHFVCALLTGMPVRLVSIGMGPRLLQLRFGETRFEFYLLPLRGFVSVYPALVVRKVPLLVFTLGGVLGNLAVIGCVAGLAAAGAVPDSAVDPLPAIAFAQVCIIVGVLLPHRVIADGVEAPSDGLRLWHVLWMPRGGPSDAGLAYRNMLAPYAGPGGVQPAISAASPRILHQILRRDKLEDGAALQDYREALERELATGLSREEELLALDALITNGLISGDPAFRTRLDAWSRRAIELAPDAPTLLGSRGAVLVELGRHEEGQAMLSKVAAAEASFDALMTQLYLARAEHALGNAAVARALAEAARKTAASYPQTPVVTVLLPRLEAELG